MHGRIRFVHLSQALEEELAAEGLRFREELRGIAAKFPGLGGTEISGSMFFFMCQIVCLFLGSKLRLLPLQILSEGFTMLVCFFKYFFTVLGSSVDRKQLQQLV